MWVPPATQPSREDPLNLELTIGRPWQSPALARAWVDGDPRALGFFGRSWRDPDAYRDAAASVDRRFGRAERERAAACIDAPGPEAASRLARLVEESGYVVTTGQQPGLFTGPLYTIYKALTAVRLAEALEELLDAPVLPLFWVASEDHDWAEVDHAWVVGVDNELHRVAVDGPEGAGERALHRLALDGAFTGAVQAFLAQLPDTDFSPPWARLLQETHRPGATLPQAFHGTLRELLAPWPMGFVDADHPGLKAASVPVLRRELHGAEAHETLLARRAAELNEAGFGVQVPVLEGGVNLFVEGPDGRERLYRDGDAPFRLRHSGLPLDVPDLEARLGDGGGTVSPNVLLRPVVESWVFPTISYVAGPGETAYWGQLPPLFEAHGLEMPVVHPRFSVTVVETKVRKVLDKFGLDPDALARPFHEIAAEIAREEVPDEVRRALGELRGALGRGTARLADAARAIDPTLKGPVKHAGSVALDAVAEAEKKILQAVKRENEIALQQLEKARLHLFPDGRPQERALNAFYYLARYGPAFLEAVAAGFEVRFPSDAAALAAPSTRR